MNTTSITSTKPGIAGPLLAPSVEPARALAGLALCTLLSSLGTSVANVALPVIAKDFSVAFQQVQWVVLAYLLAITSLSLGLGQLGDLFGRRRLLLGGILLFTAGSATSGFAPGVGSLIAARAVQGMGAAAMMTLSLALLGDALPKDRIGRAMGLMGAMSAVGTALGPSLGGILIAYVGWRSIFFVIVPFGVLAFAITVRSLPPGLLGRAEDRPSFDTIGTLLLTFSLSAYALALTWGRGDFGVLNGGLLLAAAAGVSLFVLVQGRAASPIVHLSVLRDPVLRSGVVTNALVATVMMTTLIVGPFYLAGALDLPAAGIGLAMAVGPAVSALSGIPAGRLVDRLGAERTVLMGLSVMTAGAVLFSIVPVSLGVWSFVVPMLVLTPGYALFQAANNTAVMTNIGPARRGVVSGLLGLARNLGLVTGASAMGAVFAVASRTGGGTPAPPDAIAVGLQTTFSLAAVLLIVALTTARRAKSGS